MTEVSITVKGGPEYDAPWVTFKGSVAGVGKPWLSSARRACSAPSRPLRRSSRLPR